MYCPYCKGAMALGRIEAQSLLQWIPDDEQTKGSTLWAKSPRSIILSNYFLFYPAAVSAFYCSKCKKVVIDLDQ
jgi:hypothetical protein